MGKYFLYLFPQNAPPPNMYILRIIEGILNYDWKSFLIFYKY